MLVGDAAMSDIFRDYSFGGWLKSFRLKRGIGLREMCRITGMDSGNYSKIEMSKMSPPNSRKKIIELTKPLKLENGEIEMLISTAASWHLSRVQRKFEP